MVGGGTAARAMMVGPKMGEKAAAWAIITHMITALPVATRATTSGGACWD